MTRKLVRTSVAFVSAVLLLVMNATPFLAQTSRGTVMGQVNDSSGAIVPGAVVELLNKSTNQKRTATTNDSGIYRFDAVDLGEYDLKITATGFKTYVAKGISVQANRISTIDAAMETGGVDVIVDVNAETEEILQKSDAVRGGNFDRQEIVKLPLAALNPIALARILPGVTQATGSSTFGNGGQQTQFAVNGQRPRGNNYLLDGVENNDISVGGPAQTINNEDAIAEFSAQTGLFSAEFGRAGGGVFNVITRSGTNEFHGTARWLYLSQAFNALTNGNRLSGLTEPSVFTENIFGGTVGGPIIKDRTFIFGGIQADRFRSSANTGAFTVPTAAGWARLNQLFPQGANARVDLYRTIFGSLTGVTAPTLISLDRTGQTNRGAIEFGRVGIPFSSVSNDLQFLVRADHTLNQDHRLSFRYSFDDSINTPNGVNGPGFEFIFDGRDQNFLGSYTWVISPSWTNEFRGSFGRIAFQFPLSPNNNELAETLPAVSISGISGFGIQTNIPQFRIADNYLFQETMTKVLGTHTFRFGGEFLRQIAEQRPPFNERGSFNFLAGGGFTAFANFIDNFSGFRGSANRNFGDPVYHPNLFRQSYFFQDTWKMRPSLTLTLGLRYENFGQPANSAFEFPAFAGFDPAQFLVPNKVEQDNNNLGPIIGFAWNPNFRSGVLGKLFGDGKTVWRGGYQVSYDTFFNNLLSNIAADSPNTINTTNTDVLPGSSATSRGTTNWFPNAIPATARTPTPLDTQTSVFSPNIRNPYTQRWSLGFQRELPHQLVMELSYVGSGSRKLFVTQDINPLISGVRLHPQLGVRRIRDSGANSNYNSLQLRVDKRFSHGFQINTAYTWSKFMDDVSEVFNTNSSPSSLASVPVFQGGLRLDRAVSDYDRRHRFIVAYVWQIPGPKSGILGHALGGWEIAGITTFQTGTPYTIVNGADRNGDGLAGGDRPDIGNPNAPRNTRATISATCSTGFLNPDTGQCVNRNDVYVVQGTGFPGPTTLGRNTERTSKVNNFDWSLFKTFRLTERFRLEYRLESFNIFNHQQFTNVPGRSVVGSLSGEFGNFELTNGGGRDMRMGLKLIF